MLTYRGVDYFFFFCRYGSSFRGELLVIMMSIMSDGDMMIMNVNEKVHYDDGDNIFGDSLSMMMVV